MSRRYQIPNGGHNVWGCAQVISLYYIRADSLSATIVLLVIS